MFGIHHSIAPLDYDSLIMREQNNKFKPSGLWFSPVGAEYSWESWCQSEHFSLDHLNIKHIIDFDETRLLWLRSVMILTIFMSGIRVHCRV